MTITGQQIIEEVRNIVSQHRTFVYQSPEPGSYGKCFYVHDTDNVTTGATEKVAGCLLGQALVRVGIPVTDLIPFDRECGLPIGRVVERLDVELTDDEKEWMTEVQRGQDKGIPWGVAVRDADEWIKV